MKKWSLQRSQERSSLSSISIEGGSFIEVEQEALRSRDTEAHICRGTCVYLYLSGLVRHKINPITIGERQSDAYEMWPEVILQDWRLNDQSKRKRFKLSLVMFFVFFCSSILSVYSKSLDDTAGATYGVIWNGTIRQFIFSFIVYSAAFFTQSSCERYTSIKKRKEKEEKKSESEVMSN